ncbi:MAG: hypothetical protein ACOYO1_16290 [Bacteroidales bacterium]
MKNLRIILFYSILQLLQITGFSQCVFMIEKPGTVNNLKYRIGDRIDLKTINAERISGLISQIRDTAIIVNYEMIMNKDISVVYIRKVLFSMFSSAGLLSGTGYVSIDGINNLLNDERPVIRNSVLKTAGFMFAAGAVLRLFSKRRLHINNEDWRIKVLDFTIIKDPGVYAKPERK